MNRQEKRTSCPKRCEGAPSPNYRLPVPPPMKPKSEQRVNTVTVRWFDSYLEEFEATEVRFGSDILFLRLADRHIPLRQVRWFGMSVESHQKEPGKEEAQ